MTKKDYELIAKTFNDVMYSNQGWYSESAKQAHTWVAKALAEVFTEENPKFNRDKFLKACGIETVKWHKPGDKPQHIAIANPFPED